MSGFTFSVAVLGCRANQDEIDGLRSHLLGLGGTEVPFPSAADMTIVNTCAVTNSALAQSRQEIRRAGRQKDDGLLLAVGCGAQMTPWALATLEGVDLVVGNRDKAELPRIFEALFTGPLPRDGTLIDALRKEGFEPAPSEERPGGPPVLWSEDPRPARFLSKGEVIPQTRSRGLLKIQDGCHHRCRYCIVPHLRGAPQSRPIDEVCAEAERLARAGFREIVLTGINLGLYGLGPSRDADLATQEHLPRLLRRLEAIGELKRIRLSSLEPMTITEPLLDALATSAKVARHLHLPLQSGADEILRRMNRPYDSRAVRSLVARVQRHWPSFGLGVDVVAGYPGEEDHHFAQTLALIEELPVSYLHAFAYSERPGTAAAEDPDVVAHAVRRERVKQLRALDEKLRRRFQERLSGAQCDIIVEQADEGQFTGMSGEYVKMRGSGAFCSGDWVRVEAAETLRPGLMGCRLLETDGTTDE